MFEWAPLLCTPEGQQAIRRPVSGEAVLLALRNLPRTGDMREMVEAIDRVGGLPGALERDGRI